MMDSGGEKKQARIETERILFVEIYGELVGLVLTDDGDSHSSEISSPPVIFCRLNLRKYGYPVGMRHVKIGDKHYLLGGAIEGVDNVLVNYSDQVFELKTDSCRRRKTVMIDEDPKVLLEEIKTTRLKDAKFAIVSNLKGKHYLLHAWLGGDSHRRDAPSVPFERLDVIRDTALFSCREAPSPPRYFPLFMNRHRCLNPTTFGGYLIVEDKLVLFDPEACDIQIFTPPDDSGHGEWSTPPEADYYFAEISFRRFPYGSIRNGIFLSESNFRIPDTDLGVLLTFQRILHWDKFRETEDKLKKDGVLVDYSFCYYFSSYDVNAYAMSRTTFQAKRLQTLAGVFSNMLPDPTDRAEPPLFLDTVSCHLLDLGEGKQEGARRICAILAGYGSNADAEDANGIHNLFISIFDVQLINPPPTDDSLDFLKVSPVMKKKLSFPLTMEEEELEYKSVLDAFFI